MNSLYTAGGGDGRRGRRVVGVANYVVATGGETLVAYGLGACVGVGLVDAEAGVAGLAHAMLPTATGDAEGPDGKYVDTAIRQQLRSMADEGAAYGGIEGWLVGGAEIFPVEDLGLPGAVGEQTVETAREELARLDIPVVAESVGGASGRTVRFDTGTGEVLVAYADGSTEQLRDGTAI
jgi:chemotaxis protein CheD